MSKRLEKENKKLKLSREISPKNRTMFEDLSVDSRIRRGLIDRYRTINKLVVGEQINKDLYYGVETRFLNTADSTTDSGVQ